MKRFLTVSLLFLMISILVMPGSALAYSYGHPGEEELAEGYKEFEKYVNQDDWENAMLVPESFKNEFDLYFQDAYEVMQVAFEEQDKQLALSAYQSALRQNIERRLKFANEQFDDYGQAKLLLAKARGTFKVLEPIVAEKQGQQFVDDIYQAYDENLTALGNPGLFGVGKVESDRDTFVKETTYIVDQLRPIFPVPMMEEGSGHLVEEEEPSLAMDTNEDIWLWLTIIFATILIVLLVLRKLKKKSN